VDALEIIDDRYFKGRPDMEALLEEADERLRLAERLREMREKQDLSQEEVANRIGTKRSVIARLEKPGYQKYTLTTLKRVARAMGYSIRVEFVPFGRVAKIHPSGKAVVRKSASGQVKKMVTAAKRVTKSAKSKV
jgi:predicted transcriptional regulator